MQAHKATPLADQHVGRKTPKEFSGFWPLVDRVRLFENDRVGVTRPLVSSARHALHLCPSGLKRCGHMLNIVLGQLHLQSLDFP